MTPVRTVHVVFKTHLDIGFTDSARNVRRAYLEEFVPAALRLARELEATSGPERFVWTTGAWLVAEYLRTARPPARHDMDQAIRAGQVAWHALPFTTHSEMMDASLFAHGLSIAARLDAGYGRRTVAAKMTDVPGHSIGIVPLLAAAGVRYLHVGTNPGSATTDVPSSFVWRAPDGSEVVVSYSSSYGSQGYQALEAPGLDQALYVSLTNDNHGPPSSQVVAEIFAGLAAQYPGAEIRAARLDDFARPLWAGRHRLPVLTQEIGDSWIHGIASDPTLVRDFRELQRLRLGWLNSGELVPGTLEHDDFSDRLLMLPEHTWARTSSSSCRTTPTIASRSLRRPGSRTRWIRVPTRQSSAGSWERRRPESGAPSPATRNRGPSSAAIWSKPSRHWTRRTARSREVPSAPSSRSRASRRVRSWLSAAPTPWGRFEVSFADDGSIASLVGDDGRIWADPDHRLAAFQYVTYGEADYARWFEQYHEDMAENADWVIPDFGKPGMEAAQPLHQSFAPAVEAVHHRADGLADAVTVSMVMSGEASQPTAPLGRSCCVMSSTRLSWVSISSWPGLARTPTDCQRPAG